MYYVNRKQIGRILDQIPVIADGLRQAAGSWDGSSLWGLVQERCLHLAIEVVTDAGSCLIDGFIMRDAGSYEDIITIIFEERVFGGEKLHRILMDLVALRKPLVQDYADWERGRLHPLTKELPEALEDFARQVQSYLDQELGAETAR
ncbi:DUF86 domain-containing protein [Paenibacillus spiritus]|uniref:DUF86 domain-containing protein n=1 Tax=Paenibacillus spiritus TaxID=2496557 RepID=A0A5J5FZL2_9BACL|nr:MULTISPECIES: HepT-like ribonuclease domain-containing protein [Paenibacillus]KAA8999788.1 DUF86 domain-containing protein [Paenibacillus spiritus]